MTMAHSLWGNAEIQWFFSIFDAGVSKDQLESRDHALSNVKKKNVMGSFEENEKKNFLVRNFSASKN